MEPAHLSRLVEEHSAALALYARQWCSVPEDVVQEAFVQLARQSRFPENPGAWLFRVVRNAAISAGRSERRRRQHEITAASRGNSWFLPAEGSSLDAAAATAALEALPADLREAVVAHLWGGRSFAEIGSLMNVSASTAHRRYLEGLAVLRERLQVPCPEKSRPRN